MATEGGAAAVGMAGRAGRIKPGYVADMVRINCCAICIAVPTTRLLIFREGVMSVRFDA